MSRSILLRGVSAGAIVFAFLSSSAWAQETLPVIDIGAGQLGAANGPASGLSPAGGDNPGGRFTGYSAVNASSAMRMDTPILQTPIAVQVVQRQTMDDQQAISVADAIVTNVSSVSLNPVGLYDNFNIRGFTTNYNVYRDGLKQHWIYGLETANLQSIEILKGPAAMEVGRVEPGGLVNLVVKRPLETPYYSVQEEAGSFGLTRTTVDATGPLTADRVWLYRVNAEYTHSDSWIDFVTSEKAFFAPTVTYHPNEQFKMNIDVEFQYDKDVNAFEQFPAILTRPAPLPVSAYFQAPSITAVSRPSLNYRELYGYDWTYNLSKDWSLTNRFAYNYQFYDASSTYLGGFNPNTGSYKETLYLTPNYMGTLSTNLDLAGKLETGPLKHSVLFGFDYYKINYDEYNAFIGSSPFAPGGNIYAAYFSWPGLPAAPPSNWFDYDREGWKGAYAQDMISAFDDRVHLLLGARYDWADTINSSSTKSYMLAVSNAIDSKDQGFSPRIGLSLQPLPWLSFYGNYTRSLGANNGVNSASNQPYAPQWGRQWEGGVKAEFFDKRLTATFAYYDIVKTNLLTPDPINPQVSDVVGKAESKGIEFDLNGRVTDNLSVIANYSHDYAIITQDNSGNVGHRLPSVPANQGNLWLKWDCDGALKGLSAGAGVSIVGEMQGDNANDFQLPHYALVNAMVAYRFAFQGTNITAQLNAKNLTDAVYYPAAQNRNTITTGSPRSVLGSLRVEF